MRVLVLDVQRHAATRNDQQRERGDIDLVLVQTIGKPDRVLLRVA